MRVWQKDKDIPGLAMSRALGDSIGKNIGIISEPEILSYTLTPNDKFIVVGTDGIWQFLSNQQVANTVYPYYIKGDAEAAADSLISLAEKMWSKETLSDDMTCVIIFLETFNIH